ncbi:MAG: dihydrolipoamide acyltransferase [Bacteroidetes bacterium]|nr:MAG: dihydrolipoamide acyltransferase [Bacteroidota bacterium]
MFPKLKPGIKGKKELIVDVKDTAANYGSGLVDVFATPAMIALMENAAHSSLQDYLSEGFLTVGSEVNIRHIKATPAGKKVWVVSELMKVQDKKLTFHVEAFDEDGKIGFGTHTRYIVEKAGFMANL